MARDTGGCRLDLSRCPLKYDGLRPWEILLSEAQERMTLAVPRLKLDEFMALAERMDVEASNLGEFTGTGYFHAVYGNKTVVWLSMEFLHEGLPRMRLDAAWVPPAVTDEGSVELPAEEQGTLLKNMLGRLNICSKEYMIRQYDHEVKGGSVVKPLVGVRRDGPGDAAVLRPVLKDGRDGPLEAVVLAHGICPKFSDYDTYWMMANAIDEAVRNAAAVGADPERMAGVDNFCWCDPVQSEKTPDGQYKLAHLVRANQALADFCLAFNLPCISGKDSMKNDYNGGGVKISIPPTVLFSLLGFMPDASKAVTSDFKKPGEIVYLLGLTNRELAGSELYGELGKKTGLLPQVDALTARRRYRTLYQAMQSGLVTACHDLSDGGLAVALAEMSIGGRLGADIEVNAVPAAVDMSLTELLYSESAGRLLVTVSPEKAGELEALFGGQHCGRLGRVNHTPYLSFRRQERIFLREAVENLASAFKKTLDW
jgi:phosphoribosylformylglycinamidine synthase